MSLSDLKAKVAKVISEHIPVAEGKVGISAEKLSAYQLKEAAQRGDSVDAIIAQNAMEIRGKKSVEG